MLNISLSKAAAPSPGAVTKSKVMLCPRNSSNRGDEVPQIPRQPVEAIDEESFDAAGPLKIARSAMMVPVYSSQSSLGQHPVAGSLVVEP